MPTTLTEDQWAEVFRLRCRSKRGDRLFPDEQKLIEQAFRENRQRYVEMNEDVFNSTIPFGSSRRWTKP